MNAARITTGGTAVYEPTGAEFAAFLEQAVGTQFAMSVDEFDAAVERGDLDESSPEVSYLVALLSARTNGD
jgi:hypothetical protein